MRTENVVVELNGYSEENNCMWRKVDLGDVIVVVGGDPPSMTCKFLFFYNVVVTWIRFFRGIDNNNNNNNNKDETDTIHLAELTSPISEVTNTFQSCHFCTDTLIFSVLFGRTDFDQ